MTTVREIGSYENYGRCVELSNGSVSLLVTVDVGPRIIRCGFTDGDNIMFNDLNRDVCSKGEAYDRYYYPGAAWYIYGGHRLWISPESEPETYYPDNVPVAYTVLPDGAVFTQQPQEQNHVAFQMEIRLDAQDNIIVDHRVTNIGREDKTFAVWALTVLNQGGLEIIPQNPERKGLLPNRRIIAWPYSNMADPRVYFGLDFITLRQDPSAESAFKLGLDNKQGTAVYAIGDTVFINRFPYEKDTEYVDFGCNFETYTSDKILEMETLSRIGAVCPGETVSHTEHWSLRRNTGTPDARDEAALHAFVSQYLN